MNPGLKLVSSNTRIRSEMSEYYFSVSQWKSIRKAEAARISKCTPKHSSRISSSSVLTSLHPIGLFLAGSLLAVKLATLSMDNVACIVLGNQDFVLMICKLSAAHPNDVTDMINTCMDSKDVREVRSGGVNRNQFNGAFLLRMTCFESQGPSV